MEALTELKAGVSGHHEIQKNSRGFVFYCQRQHLLGVIGRDHIISVRQIDPKQSEHGWIIIDNQESLHEASLLTRACWPRRQPSRRKGNADSKPLQLDRRVERRVERYFFNRESPRALSCAEQRGERFGLPFRVVNTICVKT